jgi:hypothetical protein
MLTRAHSPTHTHPPTIQLQVNNRRRSRPLPTSTAPTRAEAKSHYPDTAENAPPSRAHCDDHSVRCLQWQSCRGELLLSCKLHSRIRAFTKSCHRHGNAKQAPTHSCSNAHTCTHGRTCVHAHTQTHTHTPSLPPSLPPSLTHSLTHSLARSLMHIRTHARTHARTHLRTHARTHDLQAAGADMVLVGDSLGMVMCGQDTTVGVTLREVEYVHANPKHSARLRR